MYLAAFPDVFYLSAYGLAVVVLSILAHRKNRNPFGWGFIGGLFGPCSVIYLLLLPRVCPKCKESCHGTLCPNCDSGLKTGLAEPAPAPLLNAL